MIDARKAQEISEDSVNRNELLLFLDKLGKEVIKESEAGKFKCFFDLRDNTPSFQREILHILTQKGYTYTISRGIYVLSWAKSKNI